MIYLTAQPNTPYFIWQLRVQLSNFENVGIDLKNVHILLGYKNQNQECLDFVNEFRLKTNIYCILDRRQDKNYLPSIRHFLISSFLVNNPILQKEDVFLLDSDVLFVSLPNYEELLKDNNYSFFADTQHYLGIEYINSKGKDMLKNMSKIVRVDEELIKSNQDNVGGAQYIFRGMTPEFWDDVYNKSIELFNFLKSDTNQHPIQAWCADMWVILWKMYQNYNTKISHDLSFSWATDDYENLFKFPIYHNAGVVNNKNPELFFKGQYIDKNPLKENFDQFSNKYCSYFYIQEIKRVQENF